MGLITKQDLDNYYTKYQNNDVIFTRDISNLLGLQPKHIYIKFKDIQRPCIIYSSSMSEAKIIVSLSEKIKNQLNSENNVNLRFAVKNEEKKNDNMFFFVKCKTIDIANYKPEQSLYIVHFKYTIMPSEILISMLGKLLDAKENSSERKDERIIIDKSNIGKIGLSSSAANINIDNIPRQGIIRDLSFGGIKILLAGNAKFLQNKIVRLQIYHKDYGTIVLLGKTIRAESLANRKDIVSLAIMFDSKHIPVEYSLLINEYLKSNKIINKMKPNSEEATSKN